MPTLSQDFLRKFVQLNPSNPGKSVSNPQQIIKIPNKGDAQEDQLKIPNPKQWRICWAFGLRVGNEEMIPANSDCSHWCCSAQLIPKTCRKPVSSELMWELLQREDQNSNTLGNQIPWNKTILEDFASSAFTPTTKCREGVAQSWKMWEMLPFFSPLMKLKPAS